jgi:hypothetical protein
MAIAAPAVPGAAEAVRQAGRTDVKVMGLSLPNINKKYVHEDVVQVVVLWNTTNLGYLTVQAATLRARAACCRRPHRQFKLDDSVRWTCAARVLRQAAGDDEGEHRSVRLLSWLTPDAVFANQS